MDEAVAPELPAGSPVAGAGARASMVIPGPETQVPGSVGRGRVFMRYRTSTV
jgi:hypothetical protein